ncbi:hypothetical protein D3C85_706350 [compost metagenome]
MKVHSSLGSDATPFTVCTTLTVLVPGAHSSVGVKVRVVPVPLKFPGTLVSASLNISKVTVLEETPVMVSAWFGSAGWDG